MTTLSQVLKTSLGAALLLPLAALQGKAAGPPYRISRNMVERSITMVNYRHHPGTTKLDLRPTALLPDVHGNVEVACKYGHTEIKVKLDDITPASVLGPGYLTYVLWAITPDGQTMNLTELQPYESDKGQDRTARLDSSQKRRPHRMVFQTRLSTHQGPMQKPNTSCS